MPTDQNEFLQRDPDHIIRLPKSRIEFHVEHTNDSEEEIVTALTDLFEHFGFFDNLK